MKTLMIYGLFLGLALAQAPDVPKPTVVEVTSLGNAAFTRVQPSILQCSLWMIKDEKQTIS
jgi:hypothetical protein